jgi:MinD superfamily P-loop ATPase
MKQLVVISGKGGTGKTTLTAAFASLAENAVIADCDVDAANMHLLLDPEIIEKQDFFALPAASIDGNACTQCGLCRDNCRFGAIGEDFIVDDRRCEGCGVCEYVCPANAVIMQPTKAGEAFESRTRLGPLAHARLGIGEEAGGKLVTVVRELACRMAGESGAGLVIIDGPPGAGCAVISAMTGVDLAFVVTEPTVSGLHDLERVLKVAGHFRIPALVCINKYDLNPEKTAEIETLCKIRGARVAGKLPYDSTPADAMINGKTVIEYTSNPFSDAIRKIWDKVKGELEL